MPVAHLGHAELRVPDLDASRDFFTRVMGLFVSEETDDETVFLRAWQDWDHHTLVLTEPRSAASSTSPGGSTAPTRWPSSRRS